MAAIVASPSQSPIGALSGAFAIAAQLTSPAACNSKSLASHEVDHLRKVLAKSHPKTKAKPPEKIPVKMVKQKVLHRRQVKRALANDEVLVTLMPGTTIKVCKRKKHDTNNNLEGTPHTPKGKATPGPAKGKDVKKEIESEKKPTTAKRRRLVSVSEKSPQNESAKPRRGRKLLEPGDAKTESPKPKRNLRTRKVTPEAKENVQPKPKRIYTRKPKIGQEEAKPTPATDSNAEKKKKTVKFDVGNSNESTSKGEVALTEGIVCMDIKTEVPSPPAAPPEPRVTETPLASSPVLGRSIKKLKLKPPPLDLSNINNSVASTSQATNNESQDSTATTLNLDLFVTSSSEKSSSETSSPSEDEETVDRDSEKIDQYEAIEQKLRQNLEKVDAKKENAKKEKPKIKIEEVRAVKKQIAKKLKSDKKLYQAVDKMSRTVAKYFNPNECDTEDTESSNSTIACGCGECSDDSSSEESTSCSGCSNCLDSESSSESDWDF